MLASLNRRVGGMHVRGVVLDASASNAGREEVEELFGRRAGRLVVCLLVEMLDCQRQAVQAQIQF